MKKFTVIVWYRDTTKKMVRTDSQLDAMFTAWEEKMKGNKVKVVNDDTTETIYC